MTAGHIRIERPGGDWSRSTWIRRLQLFAFIAVAIAIGVSAGAAWAYWLATTTAGSNGASAATSVNAGATPTASAVGPTVTVSWTASTLASGQAVTGYLVKRYDASTLVAQTILSACSGTVTSTSCVESSVPTGSWKYSITPVFATNWVGAESAKSTSLTVDATPPTNSITLTNITGGAFLNGSTIYYAGAAVGSLTLRNAVADAGSGPASSQTAALTGTTTGWTHTPSTVSTPSGGPYVSAPFAWTAGATSGPGEVVTGRDVATNATTSSFTFVNDSTGPSGGSVNYVNGSTGGTTVSVTFAAGTDSGSGLGAALLQRASASLTSGTCGSYSAFATVTGGTNPTSPFTDTVTYSNCYKYQYVVTDNVGNSTTLSSANVATTPYSAYYAFNENAGTSAADSTGDLYTGTLQAGAGWTTGRVGASALNVNGTSTGWVDVARPVIDTSKSYTVAGWVKLNNVTGYQSLIGIDGTTASPFFLQLDGGPHTFRFAQTNSDTANPGFTVVNGVTPVASTWYHLAGVYDKSAGTMSLYVNGASQGSVTAPTTWAASGHTAIGRAFYGGANTDFLNGAIDEVHFYDRALSATEVSGLATGSGAYYAFEAGSGTTAADSSGSGNTATLQAGAGWTTGKVGTGALNLTGGSTSWASSPAPAIDSSQSYTVATWVKLNSLTGFQTFAAIDGTNISPFYLQLNGGVFAFTQRSADSTSSTAVSKSSAAAPTTGTWYHVVGVYDKTANTLTLYVNGVSQGSVTATTAWKATGATTIGRADFGGPVDYTNGALDETRFYSRALSAAEVAALP